MDKQTKDKVIYLYSQGYTYRYITEHLNVSKSTVYRLSLNISNDLYMNRLKEKEKRRVKSSVVQLPLFIKRSIYYLRSEGNTVSYICNRYSISRSTYYRVIKEMKNVNS